MKMFTVTENSVNVEMPRLLKEGIANFRSNRDKDHQLKLIRTYANQLEKALKDLKAQYGDDLECRAILQRYDLLS